MNFTTNNDLAKILFLTKCEMKSVHWVRMKINNIHLPANIGYFGINILMTHTEI